MLVQELYDNVLADHNRFYPIHQCPCRGLTTKDHTTSQYLACHRANNTLYLIQTSQLWTQSTVHAKDLLVNESGTRKAVEAVRERPELNSKSPLAFTVECIDMINQGTLMVSAKDEEVLWVQYLILYARRRHTVSRLCFPLSTYCVDCSRQGTNNWTSPP